MLSFCHFPCFFRRQIVHQLGEIFLEVILCIRAQLCVELDVAPKPRLFLKTYTPMNLFNSQTEIEILFQCLMMSSVSLFITQIWNQFFYAIKNKSLRSKWIIFLKIVYIFWILKVNFKDTRNISPVVKARNPSEISNRKRFIHCPSIKTVCIELDDAFCWLCFIISFTYIRIICPSKVI